jgi:hypothetical protein
MTRFMIETHIVRVEIHTCHLIIKLVQVEPEDGETRSKAVLSVPWQKMAPTPRREILIPEHIAAAGALIRHRRCGDRLRAPGPDVHFPDLRRCWFLSRSGRLSGRR